MAPTLQQIAYAGIAIGRLLVNIIKKTFNIVEV